MRQLTQEGVSALIFDLRGVSSSNAEYVMDMLELFCPKGDIACSKAKDGTLTSLGESDAASYDLPMAVLVLVRQAAGLAERQPATQQVWDRKPSSLTFMVERSPGKPADRHL